MAGKRLYTFYDIDHENLFNIVQSLEGQFIMTYDDVPAVHKMADYHRFETTLIAMKNSHHSEMNELIISRSLQWLNG